MSATVGQRVVVSGGAGEAQGRSRGQAASGQERGGQGMGVSADIARLRASMRVGDAHLVVSECVCGARTGTDEQTTGGDLRCHHQRADRQGWQSRVTESDHCSTGIAFRSRFAACRSARTTAHALIVLPLAQVESEPDG